MNEDKQSVEFTQKQFKTLLKLAYLGNWMANANRDGSVHDPHKEEYEVLEDYLFSFAKKFGLDEWVDDEEADKGKYYPTRQFEEGIEEEGIIDDYDNESFWDELIDRLADRDCFRVYSKEQLEKISHRERVDKLYEFRDTWGAEFEKHGIKRLAILQ
jgi:hypothetical protein